MLLRVDGNNPTVALHAHRNLSAQWWSGRFLWHGNHMSYDGSTCVHLVRHSAERLELGGDGFDLAMKSDLDFCC